MKQLTRITLDPAIMGGKACIRGLRVTVGMVVGLLAAGRSREEILQAYRAVAASEGVFCEPASAASVAGVMKLNKQGGFREGEIVVCTLTGHGLKDADTAINVSAQPKTVRATREDVARLLRM